MEIAISAIARAVGVVVVVVVVVPLQVPCHQAYA
jgi:hypothetical protein